MNSGVETDESLLRVSALLMHEGREETRRGRKLHSYYELRPTLLVASHAYGVIELQYEL